MSLAGVKKPDQVSYMKALIYGPGGYGKTTLLGTAQLDPRTAPMLLLDYEGNTESLRGLDIDVKPIRSWDDLTETYRYLRDENHGYKSVGIDSITEVNFWALAEQISSHADVRRAKGEETDQPQIQDFGRTLNQMRRILRMFRDLPLHVFYTAIDDTADEPGEGRVKIPLMVGQMRQEIGAMMSVVGCLALQETKHENRTTTKERVLLLHDIPRFRVKARSAWQAHESVPEILEAPTVGRLMDVILPSTVKTPKEKVIA